MAIKYGLYFLVIVCLLQLGTSLNENETRKCIIEYGNATSLDDVCGKEGNRSQSCENAFYSVHVCLLNNECYKANPAKDVIFR